MKIDKSGAVIPVDDASAVPSFGAAADGDADRNVTNHPSLARIFDDGLLCLLILLHCCCLLLFSHVLLTNIVIFDVVLYCFVLCCR
jgi:hypothetical protein